MSVAMVMPETGLAEDADQADDARADGDEEESEDDDEKRSGEVGGPSDICAGNGLELQEEEHEDDDEQRAEERRRPWIRSSSVRMRFGLLRRCQPGRMFLKPAVSALTMVGMVLSRVMRPAAATAPAPMGRM